MQALTSLLTLQVELLHCTLYDLVKKETIPEWAI